jgi:tetratricopeptide (TPR) repeat protein
VSLLVLPLALYSTIATAADPFTQGCASYTAGNYAAAKTQFTAAIKAKPKSWQAQYQLANTCLQLKETENAKQAYQKCLTLKPDAEIKKNCQSAMAYLLAPPKPVAPMVEPKKPIEVQNFRGSSLGSRSESSLGSPEPDARQQAIEAQRNHILSEAKEQADRIKEEGKRAIEEGNANSNRRYRSRETGERYTSMSQDEISEMTRDYEHRANQVLQEAKRRAEAINSP